MGHPNYAERLVQFVSEVSGLDPIQIELTIGYESRAVCVCRLRVTGAETTGEIARKLSVEAMRNTEVDLVWAAFEQMAEAAARWRVKAEAAPRVDSEER